MYISYGLNLILTMQTLQQENKFCCHRKPKSY